MHKTARSTSVHLLNHDFRFFTKAAENNSKQAVSCDESVAAFFVCVDRSKYLHTSSGPRAQKYLQKSDFWVLYASREKKLKISTSFAKHTRCLTTITRGLLCASDPLEVLPYIFGVAHAKITPKIGFRLFTKAAEKNSKQAVSCDESVAAFFVCIQAPE